jgi:hypothetical protein
MANGERTTEVLVSTAVLLAIPCLFVILRCYVRACIVKALGWDDAAMILAMVSVFSHCLSHVKVFAHTNSLASGILYHIRSLCVRSYVSRIWPNDGNVDARATRNNKEGINV